MTRRQLMGTAGAGLVVPALRAQQGRGRVPERAEGPRFMGSPVSLALLRAVAPERERDPALRVHTMRLLHEHLGTDVNFYRQAAPEMLAGLRLDPGVQHVNLANIREAYSYCGIAEPSLSSYGWAAEANLTNLDPLLVNGGDGLSRQVGTALDRVEQGPLYDLALLMRHMGARAAATGSLYMAQPRPMDEGSNAGTIVAGGAALVAAGATAINIGIGVGTAAGATFTSSVVATVLVTGGAGLLIVGVAILGYEIERMLTR